MRFSVVIPAFNEAANIEATLHHVRQAGPFEVIVVDGGSSDDTVVRAEAMADQVVTGVRGRAAQMNAGASRSSGDALLFLHADCQPSPEAIDQARVLLKRCGVAAGCYRMQVPLPGAVYRSIEWCAEARVRLFGYAYGDQGLFLRTDLYHRLGGFPEVRFMEDVLMSRRIRKHGRIVVARSRLTVSPRRWQRVGVIRQTLRNWTLTALAASGVHPDHLAKYYPPVR